MLSIGPNTALALAFSGVLGIYLECLRPGSVIAGCIGIALLLWGAYSLYGYGPTGAGCLLLALAGCLFLLEIWVNTRFVVSVAATFTLFAGLKYLLPAPHGVHSVFAMSLSLTLGLITALLCVSAREARRNKRSDLPPL